MGESNPSNGPDKGKSAMEEKGKRASHRNRIRMDFDPKTSKICDWEVVDKYMVSYDFHWSPGIKLSFAPMMLMLPQLRLIMRVCICIPWCWHLD